MLSHPLTALGGSDAGAHVRVICDASIPTYMLTHWVRGHAEGTTSIICRSRFVVRKLSGRRTAVRHVRSRNAPTGDEGGYQSDRFDRLGLNHPEMINDLPAEMPRLMQTANGYIATFVSGEAVQEKGRETGARPGKVVRGAPRPAL